MKTRTLIGATLATLLAAVGCDRAPTEPSAVPSQQLAAAPELERPPVATPPGLLVSVNWLAENRTRPNVVVLHVGSLATYNLGHVPGAWFVNLGSLQSTQNGVQSMLNPPDVLRSVLEAAGVTTSQHVIVTGDGPLPAARGFFILEYLGHPGVQLLDGGRAAWQAAFGLSTDPASAARPGRMVTPVRTNRLVTADWVQARLGGPGVTLLDARPAGAFGVEDPRRRQPPLDRTRGVDGDATPPPGPGAPRALRAGRSRPARRGRHVLHVRHDVEHELFRGTLSRLQRPPVRRLDVRVDGTRFTAGALSGRGSDRVRCSPAQADRGKGHHSVPR